MELYKGISFSNATLLNQYLKRVNYITHNLGVSIMRIPSNSTFTKELSKRFNIIFNKDMPLCELTTTIGKQQWTRNFQSCNDSTTSS